MINWKNASLLGLTLLFCLAVLSMMALPAVATSTQPATEPTTETAEPDISVLGPVLGLGTVLLVLTWAMVIWLMGRVAR